MKTVRVRLDGEGGMPMPEKVLKSVYVSGMDFEPEERRMRICPDGTVEIQSERTPYMVHAKMTVPLYGQLWVMADNQGEGYRSDFVDFVTGLRHLNRSKSTLRPVVASFFCQFF